MLISILRGNVNVGFGLLIGSALIGFGVIPPMCYYGQKQRSPDNDDGSEPAPLALNAWPICRDTVAYLVALAMVSTYLFVDDGNISIYESSSLLVVYAAYILAAVYAPAALAASNKKSDENMAPAEFGVAMAPLHTHADKNTGLNESTPLLADVKGNVETEITFSRMGCLRCLLSVYTPVETVFDYLFEKTIPAPPPVDGLQTSAGWAGTGVSMLWLALISDGIYELVLLICDMTSFLNPSTLGAVLLSVGAQVHS